MIKSIELRNWKTHKDTTLEFASGTNILIGQMGSGKSSIMDAISFSLFGVFPAIQHRRVNISKLIRNKPGQERSAYVRLVMSLDGNEYRITRELSLDGKSTATIERNGEYLQSQPQRVSEEIARILKVDYDMFSRVVYSEQNGLDYFLNLRSSDRKKQIDGLLGLDRFAIAQDNSTTLVNRIHDMIADSERIIREFNIDRANSELDAIKIEIGRLKEEKETAEAGIKKQSAERSRLESESDRMKAQNNLRNALSKEIEGIGARMGLLESEIAKIDASKLPDKDIAASEKSLLKKRLEALKLQDRDNDAAMSTADSDRHRIESEISGIKRDIEKKLRKEKELGSNGRHHVEKELAELDDAIDKMSADLAHSKSLMSDTEAQLKELMGHVGKCPVCERDLSPDLKEKISASKKDLIAEHKHKSQTLDKDLLQKKVRQKELNALLASLDKVEEDLKEYAGIEGKLRSLESEHAKAVAAYDKFKVDKRTTSKGLADATENMQKIDSMIEMIERRERYVYERSKLSESLLEKSGELDAIHVDEKMLDKVQSELVRANAEISRHCANLESATKYLRDKEIQARQKEAEIGRINSLNEGIAKKKLLVDNLSKFKLSLAETQSMLRSQLVTSINDIMSEIWGQLYPYGDYTGIILDASEDDYGLMLRSLTDGKHVWEDVESVASGGERSTACLALRIAFSLVLVPNLKWLILDEPTHNIDREGLYKFVQMFSETLPSIIDQVFIVTHDDLLKQVANARIYVLSRNKNENKGTEIAVA
ncbi:MAG: SMC family ATPase [Candidatus Marsarchaeota archaeon]|nr:SMC family ATPase [Candidatus Marsarchaeota archaeon]MCL5413439.1 SMC family ATPase [Candidatus Marsarchaeota archaeon]